MADNIENLRELLSEWKLRLNKAQIGHYIATERAISLHHYLGIPLVALSAFVSTSLFLDLSKVSPLLMISMIASSIATTILASLQTFLRPSEKAESHRTKAAKYGSLRRRIELFLIKNSTKQEMEQFLSELQVEWDHTAADAPVTPRDIRKRISVLLRNEIKENHELAKQPSNIK
jgi:hypothetical protein